MGTSGMTDSFTPRRLSQIRITTPMHRNRQLVGQPCGGEKAENSVGAARDRERDGQQVVDQERAPRYHADRRRQELARHQVTAAAGRKELYDLVIARADDEDRNNRSQRDKYSQVRVPAERQERLLRPVAGRGKAVGAQPDPGEKGYQGKLVEY